MDTNQLNNSRGSEWRKWDLQVQPIKNCWFTNLNENRANIYQATEQFIDNAIREKINVIAITDHNTGIAIDKAIDYSQNKEISILPGVELDANSGEHIIIIFNQEYKERIQKKSWEEVVESFLQTKCNIEPPYHINGVAKKVGLPTEELIKLINAENVGLFIFAHCTSNDGFFQRCGDANKRKNIVMSFFEKNINFIFEIKEADKELEVRTKISGWGLQDKFFPIISSSDANQATDVGKFFTWIKADTTFEGLKQILYEPERANIQETKPEEKSVYQVIDTVIVSENNFWNDTIYLSENLNAIIGGRSTGKSTLLKAIAKKIDNKIESDDEFVKSHLGGVSIKWKDNEDVASRDIDFFPQSYMYEIAKDEKKTNKVIQDIIRNKDENEILEEYKNQNEILKKSIAKDILEIFQIQSDIDSLQTQLKEKGDKKGVETEVARLNSKISDLSKNSQTSIEDLSAYRKLLQEIESSELLISEADNDLKLFEKMKITTPIRSSYPTENGFDNLLYSLNNSELSRYFNNLTEKTEKEWLEIVEQFEKSTIEGKTKNNCKIEEIKKNEVFIKVTKYYNDNKELNDVQNKLKEENAKLQEIAKLEKQLFNSNTQKNNILKNIIDNHLAYKTNTQNIVKSLSIEFDGVKITLKMNFRKQDLRNFVESRLNQRGYDRQDFIETFINQYETDTFNQCVSFLSKALNKEIDYKNYNTNENVVNEFFTKNWFDYSYELSYQDDIFSEMSEGKQAFVILKLLLDFSTKKCPILIDQPEDSLDNRAIYNELVQYLKNKKKERQIILVTHNPNVVVSADAENVIVANQNGNNSLNKDNLKFQYINGALENTFSKIDNSETVLESQGIREHVCEILEGGKEAFEKREKKYGF